MNHSIARGPKCFDCSGGKRRFINSSKVAILPRNTSAYYRDEMDREKFEIVVKELLPPAFDYHEDCNTQQWQVGIIAHCCSQEGG
jgi:hypothetical protein